MQTEKCGAVGRTDVSGCEVPCCRLRTTPFCGKSPAASRQAWSWQQAKDRGRTPGRNCREDGHWGDGEGRWRVLAAFGLERLWSWIAREDESARPLFRKAPRVSSVFAACAGWRAPRSTCPDLKRSVAQPCERVLRRQLAGEATLFLWPCGCDVA